MSLRPILTVVGTIFVLVGLLWIGQGLGWVRWPSYSFMIDQRPWAFRGGMLAAIGLAAIFLARRR